MTKTQLLGENEISIHDLEGKELELVRDAIESDTGYTFAQVLEEEITLIRDEYFEDYAWELAEDMGIIDRDKDHQWPLSCIDWERAAEELQNDYTSFDVEGPHGTETYWFRAF